MTRAPNVGRFVYGALFVIALPLTLIYWTRSIESALPLPAIPNIRIAFVAIVVGSATWLAGVLEIIRRGHGLPMNAFPPPTYVSSGIYRLVAHPIYVGWTLACAGVAVTEGSAAGFFITTPLVALGCTALVLGHEHHDLRRRFGRSAIARPWLALPLSDETPPRTSERLAQWFLVGVPWLACHYALKMLGVPRDSFSSAFDFERHWPVYLWTVVVYASAYVVVPLAAFAAPTRSRLRLYALQGLVATGVLTLIYLVLPIAIEPRTAPTDGMLGRFLAADRASDTPGVAAFPSFHALWAFFAADALAARSRGWSIAGWTWAIAVAISCITTGMHAVADVAAAFLIWIPLRRPATTWRSVLDVTERLANSWRAQRVGPWRVMSHGVFAGAAAAIGVLGITILAESVALPSVLVIAISALLGAGLWAQLVEGSSSLLRPFGYYGAIAGALIGTVIVGIAGGPAAVLLAATAVVAPFVQAIGRLRCIVQGCCHGGETEPPSGIRVTNPHSRVVSLAHLGGRSIHPTQLYSIVGNIVVGALLCRAWFLGLPVWLITGAYLLLAGLARFIEEGFRNEPQTMHWRGLPIYQHLAVASVILGAWMCTWPGAPAPPAAWPDLPALALSVATGLVYWFAMGVDLPESTRRFARLSG